MKVRPSGGTGGQMGEGGHRIGRGLYIFLWTGKRGSSVRGRIFRTYEINVSI
jgi:hypothetical protein